MRSSLTYTKKELAVVLGCMVLAVVSLGAIGSGGRERAKRVVCLSNLGKLTVAWVQFANDNDGKLVNGDTGEYGYPDYHMYALGGEHYGETPWVLPDWKQNTTIEEKKQAILEGALYPYCKKIRLYKCPTGTCEEFRSYSVVDAMNCKGWEWHREMLKIIMDIRRPAERFVFVDHGGNGTAVLGGWSCFSQHSSGSYRWMWWDAPPIRHDYGTTFAFADGHGEYWKWEDERTVEYGLYALENNDAFSDAQPNNPDIDRVQIAVWGRLGYTP